MVYKFVSARMFFSLFLSALLFGTIARGQEYSYVYIQGDKTIPFYVKLEGEMLPRYGKNYAIISRLEPGVIHLEILFQQNAYPPHQFRVKVPEDGSRSFLLTRRTDGFSLFDLQQGYYLQAGNTPEDDQLPVKQSDYTPISYQEPKTIPEPAPKQHKEKSKPTPAPKPQKEVPTHPTVPVVTPPPGTPRFIEDIELYSDHTVPPAPSRPLLNPSDGSDVRQLIPNSDCPQPVTEDRFQIILSKTTALTNEEARLGYLNSELKNCYSTAQASKLVQTLESNAARYSWLKRVYPRITDQAVFGSLHTLFSDDAWKSHFLDMTSN